MSIRADLQKKVAQLKERIKERAKVQEGDEPCDNVEELDEAVVQLEDLIYRINITNVQIVQDGDSLTRLIANRDVLSMRVKALKEVVNYVAASKAIARSRSGSSITLSEGSRPSLKP